MGSGSRGGSDAAYAPINDKGSGAPAAGRALFIRGLLLAVLVGLCGGSTLVPIKFSPFQSGTVRAHAVCCVWPSLRFLDHRSLDLVIHH